MSKLMDEVIDRMVTQHKSRRTVKAYCSKIREYIYFTRAQQRQDLNDISRIEKYLTHLAVERNVSATTSPV